MQSFQQNHAPLSSKETLPQIASNQKSLEKPLLSPFLAKSLNCSGSGSACYDQKRNMIIVDWQNILQFYNATTFHEVKTRELHDWPLYMSFCDEIDTCIIACASGFLSSYNTSNNELKQLTLKGQKLPLKRNFCHSQECFFLH